jgi:Reverse transcriptase (RNA-dependent DNA polymerase)
VLDIYDLGSGHGETIPLQTKDLANKRVPDSITARKNRNLHVTILRIDRGESYTINVQEFCKTNGIELQAIPKNSSNQNGGVERYHQTLFTGARTILEDSQVEFELWPEAIKYVNDIHNNLPSIRNPEQTPNQLMGYRTRRLTDYHPFGSIAYVHIEETDRGRSKLKPRARPLIYLGPETTTKAANRFWDKHNRTIIISDNAKFTDKYEHELANENKTETDIEHEIENEHEHEIENETKIEESTHETHLQNAITFTTLITKLGDEPSVKQALESSEATEWQKAMEEELKAMQDRAVYEEVNKTPTGHTPITSKWVLKRKRDQDGNITKYKARLVARGFNQIEGQNYAETFAPTGSLISFRLIISLAQLYKLQIFHLDVETAFLYGKLDYEVYMRLPDSHQTVRLLKSIYGLKQAGYIWNQLLHQTLLQLGYNNCTADPCLYVKFKATSPSFLVTQVDDMGIATADKNEVTWLITELQKEFKVKFLGQLQHYNGMNITRNTENIIITQHQQVTEFLQQNGTSNRRHKPTPMETNLKILQTTENHEPTKYRSRLGTLLFYARFSRPDILMATCMLSRYNQAPTKDSHHAIEYLLDYLAGTSTLGLKFSGSKDYNSPLSLVAYVDSDWAGDINDSKSTTGYIIYLEENFICAKSQKQERPAQSTTEAEYMALSECASTIEMILQLLEHLQVKLNKPTIYVDNMGAIKLSSKPTTTGRTKHIAVKYHYIRHLIEQNIVEVKYVPSSENIADLFTKPLNTTLFRKHRSSLPLIHCRVQSEGGML